MDVKKWGMFEDTDIFLYKITMAGGFEVHLCNYGASIVSVKIPNRDGIIENVHYGFDSFEVMKQSKGYQGAIVGRVASLIGFGRIELDGEMHELSKNIIGVHSTHGGPHGFNSKIWDHIDTKENDTSISITFQYISPDGDEGYPGTLTTKVTYTIKKYTEKDKLWILGWTFSATTDKKTLVNLTNHAYWNLDGLNMPIDDLELQVYAKKYLYLRKFSLAIKTLLSLLKIFKFKTVKMELRPIVNLKININEKQKIRKIFKELGDIDHNFILKDHVSEEIIPAATLYSSSTGRKLEVWTDEPNIVIYSGNAMKGLTSYGKNLHKHDGICLETMKPTNSIQMDELKDWVILNPEDEYKQITECRFSIVD